MKKFLALVLALTVTAVMALTGAALAEDTITLDFWVRLSDDFSEEIASFEAAHPGVKINQVNVGKDYDDLVAKYNAATVAGNMPQVGIVGQRHGIPQLYDAGWLIPIENYMTAEEQADILDNYWVRYTYQGVRMAVPFGTSMPMVHVNMTMLRELGYDEVPTTWDDMVKVAYEAVKDTNGDGLTDIYGMNFAADLPWYIQPLVWGAGGTIEDEAGNVTVNSPEMKLVLERIAKLVKDGVFPANQHASIKNDFVNGNLLFFFTSCATKGSLETAIGDAFEYGISYFPSDKKLDVCIGGNGLAIFKSDDARQQAAYAFIKHLISPECIVDTTLADGYVPFTHSQFASDLIQERLKDPLWSRVLDQVQYIHGQGVHPADSTIWNTMNKLISEIEANPDMDIAAALDGFQAEVDEFIMMY
ncbi:extracellular solute-binding protein [Beduinella massiliensis]|uniref:extracellular solute-binding protein n=1 Tax=Beduinella massiliensis TaxID=1852363 RepID=UPI000C81EF50